MATRFARLSGMLLAALFYLNSVAASAPIYQPYNIETLSAWSAVVIEGHIIAVVDAKTGEVKVRVDHYFQGVGIKPNDTLLVDTSGLQKPAKGAEEGVPLGVGDRLFWYLERSFDQAPGAAPTIWSPMGNGAKIICNGRVAEFCIVPTPRYRYYIADTDPNGPDFRQQPTVAAFRTQAVESIARVRDFQNAMKVAVAQRDSKQILRYLLAIEAADRGSPQMDFRKGQAQLALDKLQDFDVLDEALLAHVSDAKSFETQLGMAYLMGRIANDNLPSADRIAYVQAIPNPGDGSPRVDRPAFFFTDLAMLAVVHAKDRPFSAALMDQLGIWAIYWHTFDPQAAGDFADAMNQLKRLYDSTDDAQVKAQIELTAAQACPAQLRKFQPPCRTIISLPSVPDAAAGAPLPSRHFAASFSMYLCFFDRDDHIIRSQPILKGSDGIAHEIAFDMPTDPSAEDPSTCYTPDANSGDFDCQLHAPASLPAGKYSLYLCFYEHDLPLGRSHAVEITLPK